MLGTKTKCKGYSQSMVLDQTWSKLGYNAVLIITPSFFKNYLGIIQFL